MEFNKDARQRFLQFALSPSAYSELGMGRHLNYLPATDAPVATVPAKAPYTGRPFAVRRRLCL